MSTDFSASEYHADQARAMLDQIGKQQREDGMVLHLTDALAAIQAHALLAVAEAIRERS